MREHKKRDWPWTWIVCRCLHVTQAIRWITTRNRPPALLRTNVSIKRLILSSTSLFSIINLHWGCQSSLRGWVCFLCTPSTGRVLCARRSISQQRAWQTKMFWNRRIFCALRSATLKLNRGKCNWIVDAWFGFESKNRSSTYLSVTLEWSSKSGPCSERSRPCHRSKCKWRWLGRPASQGRHIYSGFLCWVWSLAIHPTLSAKREHNESRSAT